MIDNLKNPFLQATGTGFSLNTTFLSTLQGSFLSFASRVTEELQRDSSDKEETLFSLFVWYKERPEGQEKIVQSLCMTERHCSSLGQEYDHLTRCFTPGAYQDSSLHFLSSDECLEHIAHERNLYILYEDSHTPDGVIQTADLFQRLVQWVMRHTIDDSQCRDFFWSVNNSTYFGQVSKSV